MKSTLIKASARYLARHPWQSWLSVLGIALGVAVVIAVDVANHSARQAFELSLDRIAGRATHRIIGATGVIPDAQYVALRLEHRLEAAAPIVEGTIKIEGRSLTLLGVDPFAAVSLGRIDSDAAIAASSDLFTKPGALLMSRADQRGLGVETGDRLQLEVGPRRVEAYLAGTYATGSAAANEGLAIADIATAQELLGRIGTIDRIDLILDEPAAADLAAALPPGLRLVSAERRGQVLAQMTRAFQTNLTAMSLLAVLVGGFIVYNTMTFAVLRRRPLMGTLRTLGVTRGQLFAVVLAEAFVFGCIGALIGVALGIVTGWGLMQLVTRTIDDLYFVLTVRELFVSFESLAKGIALGLGVTLVAALGPALEAAASQPRDVLRRHLTEQHSRRLLPKLTAGGVGCMLIGLAVLAIPTRSLAIGFVALFLIVIGFSLCVPPALSVLSRPIGQILGRIAGLQGRLAARGINASISRTGIAAAALTVAISTTVGVGVMIDSFRVSVIEWLESSLSSDLYVAAPSFSSTAADGTLPGALPAALLAMPEVVDMSRTRRTQVEAHSGPVFLLALESSGRGSRDFEFIGDTVKDLRQGFSDGRYVFISEPYAYHRQLGAGDRIELLTAMGWRHFTVGAVYRDYASDSGVIVMDRNVYSRLWEDDGLSSLGLVLANGTDLDAAATAVRALADRYDKAIRIVSNRSIREESLVVFDRTFKITEVLRLLAIGIAFVGVLSALMALQLERGRDYAILRATGVTRGQVTLLILIQTSIMGLAAGLFAIPLGLVMGGLLIHVVNVRSFGWTMDMVIPAAALGFGVLLAWGAALLAGIYPAAKVARTDPAIALREE